MHELTQQFSQMVVLLQKNLYFVFLLTAGLWCIHFLNFLLGHRLVIFGVYPRKGFSIVGIFFYAFIHANFNHLFFNSIPFFILACFVLLYGHPVFYSVSAIIIILSGLGIWLFGRRGVHVGASGLIMGYWSFLLVSAYFNQDIVTSLATAVICIYYFGGFIFHLFPTEVKSSFEAHIFGFLAGIAAFYIYPTFINFF